MSHHKMHHKHSTYASSEQQSGWVEGISSLKEEDNAVGLLQEEPERLRPTQGNAKVPVNASGTTSSAAGDTSVPAPSLASITCQEDFDAVLEHSLGLLVAELNEVGETVVEVGAPHGWGPVGLDSTLLEAVLCRLRTTAAQHSANVSVVRTHNVDVSALSGTVPGVVYMSSAVLVRKEAGSRSPSEVRVAIIGNVDSGKSTMVGVLTRSMLDDGRGLARSKVFKHHHEEETGRTSAIGQHTLCLDGGGNILNDGSFKNQTCADYIARASKVITLVDLAGHEKYFRTTAYGLTGHLPDYACLIIGANMGIVGMSKEHLGVALALKVPVFFVVTKIDICPEHILKNTVQTLCTILKKPGVRKKPFLVRNLDDVLLVARNMNTDSLAPIFLTSAVTGKGLDLVRTFHNLIPQRQKWADKAKEAAEFIIDETFGVPGVGTVVAGTVKKGCITHNSTLLMGPDIADGSFKPVSIKSIHYKRLPVGQVVAGQTAALALKKIKRQAVRKGMVLVDEHTQPAASWEFDADIAILTHSTTIQPRYQAVIHCEIIRQAARVVAMDRERLRSGDRAVVRFRFMQRPEYVTSGTRFVFREGRTKGIGIVIGTEHDAPKEGAVAGAAKEGAGAAKEGGAKAAVKEGGAGKV